MNINDTNNKKHNILFKLCDAVGVAQYTGHRNGPLLPKLDLLRISKNKINSHMIHIIFSKVEKL